MAAIENLIEALEWIWPNQFEHITVQMVEQTHRKILMIELRRHEDKSDAKVIWIAIK